MTGQERDHGEVLSRVLHSTTDQIEPVGDGLTKIQARLAEPWLKRQWLLLRNEFTVLGWVFVVRCQSWFSTLRSRSAAGADAGDATADETAGDSGQLRSLQVLSSLATRASAKRRREADPPRRGSAGPVMPWLRSALAVAGAVVLVVAGVFALGQIKETIGLTNDNPGGTSSSTQSGGPGSTNGRGGPETSAGSSATQGSGTTAKPGNSPSSKLSPSPASASPSPSPASASASPSPSPTSASSSPSPTTTSPSPSPTPTATPTTTNGPLTSSSPAPSAG